TQCPRRARAREGLAVRCPFFHAPNNSTRVREEGGKVGERCGKPGNFGAFVPIQSVTRARATRFSRLTRSSRHVIIRQLSDSFKRWRITMYLGGQGRTPSRTTGYLYHF